MTVSDDNPGAAKIAEAAPSTPELSVIVPMLNEEAVLPKLETRVRSVLDGTGADWEVVVVDDGSRDNTRALLRALHARDGRFKFVGLSRNFGHQVALTAGLQACRGAAVVIIDADLQDPPELIPQMLEMWRRGYDVVCGKRSARQGEGPIKLLTASLFYRLLGVVSRLDIPADTGDFRLLSRRAVDTLLTLPERHRFLRGMSSWIGFRQVAVEYEREPRAAGDTKYSIRKMLAFAFDGLTSFSFAPLRVAWFCGLFVAVASAASLLPLVAGAFFTGSPVNGLALVAAGLAFLGGVQLVCLGLMGEYVGRIYDEVLGRPLYVVDETAGCPPTRFSGRIDRA